MTFVPAPAVDLTIHVRYPLPRLTAEHEEFGITSLSALVAEELSSLARDPEELVELLESGRSSVSYDFEIDAADHEFEGGEFDDAGPIYRDAYGRVPREFHGLGSE